MEYAEGVEDFLGIYHKVMPEDFFGRPVEEQRQLYLDLADAFPYALPENVDIFDREIPVHGRPAAFRVYRPRTLTGPGVIVYFHGGGFVVGSVESHHSQVAELAASTGLVTVAASFPRAPEHPFPAAPEACYDLLVALREHPGVLGPGARTATPVLCGDSSGANLSVALCLMCRDRGGPRPAGQGLIGPVLDFARWYDPVEGVEFAGEMRYYARAYCATRQDAAHPYASPLLGTDFSGLPPAYIMSTEFDDLKDDGITYAELLRGSGTAVQLVVEPGLVHAPIRGRSMIPQVADAWRRFCAAVGAMAGT